MSIDHFVVSDHQAPCRCRQGPSLNYRTVCVTVTAGVSRTGAGGRDQTRIGCSAIADILTDMSKAGRNVMHFERLTH